MSFVDRKTVYTFIDGERDYQNSKNPEWFHAGKPTIEAEILLMEEYLQRARTSWVTKWGDKTAGLAELRSVVALGIRCFENYGVPARVMGQCTGAMEGAECPVVSTTNTSTTTATTASAKPAKDSKSGKAGKTKTGDVCKHLAEGEASSSSQTTTTTQDATSATPASSTKKKAGKASSGTVEPVCETSSSKAKAPKPTTTSAGETPVNGGGSSSSSGSKTKAPRAAK